MYKKIRQLIIPKELIIILYVHHSLVAADITPFCVCSDILPSAALYFVFRSRVLVFCYFEVPTSRR